MTAAVAAGLTTASLAYDIPAIHQYMDFVCVMSYDLHGSWESVTGHHTALFPRTGEQWYERQLNVNWVANYWVKNGTPKEKLIIGLATYGRTFTLLDAGQSGPGDPVTGAGNNGTFTNSSGFLAYYEICDLMASNAGSRVWSEEHMVPYYVAGNQWVGYEDEESFRIKLNWIKNGNYGGAMVWSLALDDFSSGCRRSTKQYPLISLMSELLNGRESETETSTQTRDTDTTTSTTISPANDASPATTTTTTTATQSSSSSTPTTTTTISLSPTTTTENATTDKETSPDKDFCSNKANGFHRNKEDCQSFYICWGQRTFIMTCQPGTVFNPNGNICDWSSNYSCN